MAFVQTAHLLAPANPNNLMSVSNERAKRAIVPISRADVTRAYQPVYTWNGGTFGPAEIAESTVLVDDAGIGDYGPRNAVEQLTSHKAGDPDYVRATTVNEPRGWIGPQEPYGPPPVSPTDDPTIASLTPNSGASGGSPIWVTIAGTKFTTASWVETGNVYTPYSRYFSPTRIDVLMDPRSSPGTINVVVVDHGVKSNAGTFTFT